MGSKHCGKRRNCLSQAISHFPTVFSNDLYGRHLTPGLVWERVDQVSKNLNQKTFENMGIKKQKMLFNRIFSPFPTMSSTLPKYRNCLQCNILIFCLQIAWSSEKFCTWSRDTHAIKFVMIQYLSWFIRSNLPFLMTIFYILPN